MIDGIPDDVTIVLIEHDMDVALDIARSITVMHHGRVLAEGDRASITSNAKVQEIYLPK